MNVTDVMNAIKRNPNCIIYSQCGLPSLKENDELPQDLKIFYETCGGVSLFPNRKYGFTIVKPMDMVLANPVIIGEYCEEDISSQWYIIAKDMENNYITIDLAKERLGRCYDSFWDRHGVVGECSIVARNFTELLFQLFCNKGKSIFWLDSGFEYIGDAYDAIYDDMASPE